MASSCWASLRQVPFLSLATGLFVLVGAACGSSGRPPSDPGNVFVDPAGRIEESPVCSCYSEGDHASTCCRAGIVYRCECNNRTACMLVSTGRRCESNIPQASAPKRGTP